MAYIQGHHINKSFATEPLFSGLNFRIDAGARIGLTGINGSGKTTLLRIITGQIAPDSGEIHVSRETAIGYLEQQPDNLQRTLLESVREVFRPLINLEEELHAINQRLEAAVEPHLLSRQSSLQEELAARGGYTYESRLLATLRGLGFTEAELSLPLTSLSGGQRSKAQLAKALLSEANLLLLDEPTNHLDIKSVEWLETFLSTWRGAFLLISHDRYFLDKLTNQTWEIAGEKLYQYNGNYSTSLEQKQAREESLQHRQESAKREAKRIEAIIEQQRRFNRERNYKTIASKQKQLERIKTDIEALNPLAEQKALDFSFATPPPGGKEVLRLADLSIGFDDRQLFTNLDLALDQSERVFLLGPNGCGKTTLLKAILGQIKPLSGYVKLGVNIIPAYFDQMSSGLDASMTILEDFTESFPKLTQGQLRGYLGRFLFSGDDVFKPIKGLSGGEKARLTLLKLMLKPANLLILDEPSNHLDLASREAVEQALSEYTGAMLVVSHDRYLINKLAERICFLQPEGLQNYLGNYDDYLAKQAAEQPAAKIPPPNAKAPNMPGKGGSDYLQRKAEQSRLRKAQSRLQKAEAAVNAAETEIRRLDEEIAAAASNYQLLSELAAQREAAQQSSDTCFKEWAAAVEDLEGLEG